MLWPELAIITILFFLLDETLTSDNAGKRILPWLNPALVLFGGSTALGLLAGFWGISLFIK